MNLVPTFRDNAAHEYEQANKFKRDPEMFWEHQGRAQAWEEAADMLEQVQRCDLVTPEEWVAQLQIFAAACRGES